MDLLPNVKFFRLPETHQHFIFWTIWRVKRHEKSIKLTSFCDKIMGKDRRLLALFEFCYFDYVHNIRTLNMLKKMLSLLGIGLLSACAASQNPHAHSQPIILESKYTFQETIDVLKQTLSSKGMTIFAQIDHQAAAQQNGLKMQPATVMVYGTPKVGTPLMVKDPSLALQLPLKVLITEPQSGKVQVLFHSAEQIVRHSQTPYTDVQNNLAKAEQLIRQTVSH